MSSPVFESLRVWHDARRLTSKIYEVTKDGAFGHDFGLRDQVRRASVSVMSNIAEGFERRGDKEFLRFLQIARGSAAEVRSQLYVAQDAGYLDARTAIDLRDQAALLVRELASLADHRQRR